MKKTQMQIRIYYVIEKFLYIKKNIRGMRGKRVKGKNKNGVPKNKEP